MLFNKPNFNHILQELKGNVEWIQQIAFGSDLKIIARVDGRLVGLRFDTRYEYEKFGHRSVERFGDYVSVNTIDRGTLLELTPKHLLTKAELCEYETYRQNTLQLVERRQQLEREKRKQKYEELKKEFEQCD